MNPRNVPSRGFRGRLLLPAAMAFLLSSVGARADLFTCGVDLGAAGRTKTWAAFTLGGGMTDSDYTGQANIFGDVGAAGNGDVDLRGNAIIHGDLYYHQGGTLKVKNHGTVTGVIHNDAASDTLLNQGVADAMNASNQAFALPVTPAYSSLTKIDHSMTITGSGCIVLKLTDFVLNGKDTLTLTGTAGTTFIINVTKGFSLADSAKIVLGPGISFNDVLFNVRGTGSDVKLSGNSNLQGILMANQRKVVMNDNAFVKGEVIANHIDLNKNAVINRASP